MGREFLPRRRRLGGRPSVVEPAGIATDPLELLLDFLDQGRAERRSSGGRFCRRGERGRLRPRGGLGGCLFPLRLLTSLLLAPCLLACGLLALGLLAGEPVLLPAFALPPFPRPPPRFPPFPLL